MRGLARDRDKRFDSFQKMRLDLLALMEPEREIASLPRRVVALLIDWALVWLVARIVLFGGTLMLGLDLDESERWETLVCSLAWFGYLWLTEWLLGYTLGKRCLKIKVVARQTGLRQSPVKLLVRTATFVLPSEILHIVQWVWLGPNSGYLALAYLLTSLASVLTWRRAGRRQLVHEWLSDTETCLAMHRRLPAAVKLQLPDWKTPLRTDKVYPLELGRFTIRGVVKTDSPDDWLLAYDQNLEREVWIHWLSPGTPPPAETRQPDSSSVRMRVIESGLDQGRHWDAFLAPPGVPLGAFVQTGGYLPWPIVGQLIASVLSGLMLPQKECPIDGGIRGVIGSMRQDD